MRDPTDKQVWASLEAYQREKACWRLGPHYNGQMLAIRDRCLTPPVMTFVSSDVPVSVEDDYERHTFRDRDTAENYIEWRGIKAALTA